MGCESVRGCDIVIVHVGPEIERAKLQAAAERFAAGTLFLTGERGILMALPSVVMVQSRVADYLFTDWEPGRIAAASGRWQCGARQPPFVSRRRRPR